MLSRQARQVHLVEHLLEAVGEFADRIGDRPFQTDLAACHGARAELVLEPHDPVAVAPPVLQPARQREQRKPGGAGSGALGAREQQRYVGIGVRAEPFLAVEPPHAVLLARHRLDRADVGAAGLLGHELRALPLHRRVSG